MTMDKTTVTVSFRKSGLAPPVFVAGSFTVPPWEPQEMHTVSDGSGEHYFTLPISVKPGTEYRYKFKASGHHDWFLDELATVGLDDNGQRCNLLKVPSVSNVGDRSSTSTPIKQVAAVAAEVADTAAKLDSPSLKPSPLVLPGERSFTDTAAENKIDTPLFAHESFGAYDFVDDCFDHGDVVRSSKSSSPLSESGGSAVGDSSIHDPTLEKFPSDRESVLDTLRKLQSSTEEGRLGSDEGQHPATGTSRRLSMESLEGNDFTLSPSLRKRDQKTSRSSSGRPRSAVSLSSIAEEPKAAEGTRRTSKDVKAREDHPGLVKC